MTDIRIARVVASPCGPQVRLFHPDGTSVEIGTFAPNDMPAATAMAEEIAAVISAWIEQIGNDIIEHAEGLLEQGIFERLRSGENVDLEGNGG